MSFDLTRAKSEGSGVSSDKARFEKVWALAVDPGAFEGEALAAFKKMRELVKTNPALAHLATAQPAPASPPRKPEATYTARITHVHPDWILILIDLFSTRAYELGLRNKITFDFTGAQTAVKVVCEGPAISCDLFEKHVDWCINYINKKLTEK